MKLFWIREVRYYKYILISCIFLIGCGLLLLDEYRQQGNNIGIITNTIYVRNITYIIPIYKVRKDNIIYNVYEHCVIENITKCNQNNFTSNMLVYFEKINGYYIITNRNHFMLYMSMFSFAFSIIVM